MSWLDLLVFTFHLEQFVLKYKKIIIKKDGLALKEIKNQS